MPVAIEALYDAADDDSATGGPDLARRIFPVVITATADGSRADARQQPRRRRARRCSSAAPTAPGG